MVDATQHDRTASEEPKPTGVGSKVGSGAAWGLLNNLILRAGSLVAGIVLARILSPDDYRVYAVALTAMTLLQSMNELGVSLALVRWEGDVRTFAPTIMTISVGFSSVLYLATYALAPLFCEAMGTPKATGVLRLLCVAVVLDGIAAVPVGILNREFLQHKRLVCDAASFITSTALTVVLAAAGLGAVSFAWGRIAGNLTSIAFYYALCPLRVRPGWDPGQARALVRFGLPLAGASLLVLGVTNIDNIVVGATASSALGFYLMAFNQSSWPLTVFSDAARRVSLAGFSRLVNDRAALERSVQRGLALLMAATIPVCALLAGYAGPMLDAVYGAKWLPAAPALRFLALLGLIRVALFVAYDLLVALGRSRQLMALQALWLVSLVPALVIGTRMNGIRGAAIAHVLVAAVIVTPAFGIVLHRLGIRSVALLAACARPAFGGVLISLSAWLLQRFVHTPWPALLLGVLLAAVVYLPIVWPMRLLLPGRAGRAPYLPHTNVAAL